MYAARSRLAWRARAALRPRGSRASSFSASTAEETVDWPIIAGGALGVGLLLSGLALKRQAWLQKVQSETLTLTQTLAVTLALALALALALTLTRCSREWTSCRREARSPT